jgi:hypothetical protein
MSSSENYKLSDSVIGHIAKSLQVALITGTDIVDNLRLIELTLHDGELVLSPDCSENFETSVNQMLSDIPNPDSPFSS